MKIYTFFSDAGHGWLRVPLDDIPIDFEITEYSYTDGRMYAYLEEDLDMGAFLNHLKEQNIEFSLEEANNRDTLVSFIRSLPRYDI